MNTRVLFSVRVQSGAGVRGWLTACFHFGHGEWLLYSRVDGARVDLCNLVKGVRVPCPEHLVVQQLLGLTDGLYQGGDGEHEKES